MLVRVSCFIGVMIITVAFNQPAGASLIQKTGSFRQATMAFDGEMLTVDTGEVTRQWRLTKRGLATIKLQCGLAGYVMKPQADRPCDWDLGGLGEARLVSLTAEKDDDERFTSDHLRVVAEFEYPHDKLVVRYVVWAYPGAPGLRTQLQLKALPGYDGSREAFTPQVVESFALATPWLQRRAFGLMQGIKTNMDAKILKEQAVEGRRVTIDWANGLVLQGDGRGLILVKESNKHTSLKAKDDVATGHFEIDGGRVAVTGAGLYPADVKADGYRTCWASWLVLYSGDETEGNLALKRFDRARYPIKPERDIFIMANTWGTEDLRPPCLYAAREQNVLAELESVADLGIDVLQIDDGWQTPRWTPAARSTEVQGGQGAVKAFGDYPVYPDGWSRVRKKAERLGVTLGLWAAWTAPTEALKTNYDQGNFKYFKLDFAHLNNKSRYDSLTQKARDLIKHSGYTARVNWDVTEIAPRMGYFSGREYGNIYLSNRKMRTVRHPVLYVPHKVLNDAWRLSRYVNLNKFQVTVQNVDHVLEGAPTDAGEYTHEYAVGIALMSSPIFFQETRHYTPEARRRVRHVLSAYKKHRRAMYEGYVFPIGDEPDNASWTGFQNHNPDRGGGYLTVFRERLNRSSTGTLALNFVQGTTLAVTDLLTGESRSLPVDAEGRVQLTIPEAPGFRFLRYEISP